MKDIEEKYQKIVGSLLEIQEQLNEAEQVGFNQGYAERESEIKKLQAIIAKLERSLTESNKHYQKSSEHLANAHRRIDQLEADKRSLQEAVSEIIKESRKHGVLCKCECK